MSVPMSSARKKEILFVFEDQKAQSRRARELRTAAIRSHAARNARRKKPDGARESSSPGHCEDIYIEPPSPTLPLLRPAKLPSIPVLLAWRPFGLQSPSSERPDRTPGPSEESGEIPSALTVLGQGRIDPFATCFTANLPLHILKYLDFGTSACFSMNEGKVAR